MKERDKFYANEAKDRILQEAGYQCSRCGGRAVSLAHRIAQTKPNIKAYGKEAIHHKLNLVAVCERQACNDYYNIGNDPMATAALVAQITEERLEEMNERV